MTCMRGFLMTREEAWTAYLTLKERYDDYYKPEKSHEEYARVKRLMEGFLATYDRIVQEEKALETALKSPPLVDRNMKSSTAVLDNE